MGSTHAACLALGVGPHLLDVEPVASVLQLGGFGEVVSEDGPYLSVISSGAPRSIDTTLVSPPTASLTVVTPLLPDQRRLRSVIASSASGAKAPSSVM